MVKAGEASENMEEFHEAVLDVREADENLNNRNDLVTSTEKDEEAATLTQAVEKDNDNNNSMSFHDWNHHMVAIYICIWATLGEVSRVFVGRFFGSDCSQGREAAPQDFLMPFFVKICVTNSGTTAQTGGALFLDLPANMLGCFIMGLITPSTTAPVSSSSSPSSIPNQTSPVPWFHPQHPIQSHKSFVTVVGTGYCGCLTTFASWNAQMVRMLDGTDTQLGPQVVPALCGYVIGLAGAVAFYLFGQLSREWLTHCFYREDDPKNDNDDEQVGLKDSAEIPPEQPPQNTTRHQKRVWTSDPIWWQWISTSFNKTVGPPLAMTILFAAFLVGALAYNVHFYEEITVGTAMAPLGALLRWKLGVWYNARPGPWPRYSWVPWGTLLANLVAAVISTAIAAVEIRYLEDFDRAWSSELLPAVKVGFAGSLSTVSTMVKEMFVLHQSSPHTKSYRSVVYGTGSLVMGMLLGLLVFSPIARSGG